MTIILRNSANHEERWEITSVVLESNDKITLTLRFKDKGEWAKFLDQHPELENHEDEFDPSTFFVHFFDIPEDTTITFV